MFSFRIFAILLFITSWCILACRSDPVEASRILEEAFRDYDKRIRPNYGGSPVTVNVSIYILSIPEIDTASMTFKLSFFIRQMWIDSRVSFNSRRNIDTITLDASTSEKIWSPDTFFVNEISSVNHDILMKNQFCRISQDGTVLLSRRVTLTAFANMSSGLFPYDSHNLVLDLESYGSQTKDLKYQWGEEAASASSMRTPGFQIGNIFASDTSLTTSTGSYSRLTVRINATRKSLPYELGFMLPIGLLALLCWGSMYIKNATLGALTPMYLVSLMTLMNGLFLTSSGSSIINNISCLSPLQMYYLLSSGFGLMCLICRVFGYGFVVVVVSQDDKLNNGRSDGVSGKSKSRTESTSENCKVEDLPYGANLDDADRYDSQGAQKSRNFMKCFKGCRPNGRKDCVRHSLLVLLLGINVLFFLVFRLLR